MYILVPLLYLESSAVPRLSHQGQVIALWEHDIGNSPRTDGQAAALTPTGLPAPHRPQTHRSPMIVSSDNSERTRPWCPVSTPPCFSGRGARVSPACPVGRNTRSDVARPGAHHRCPRRARAARKARAAVRRRRPRARAPGAGARAARATCAPCTTAEHAATWCTVAQESSALSGTTVRDSSALFDVRLLSSSTFAYGPDRDASQGKAKIRQAILIR